MLIYLLEPCLPHQTAWEPENKSGVLAGFGGPVGMFQVCSAGRAEVKWTEPCALERGTCANLANRRKSVVEGLDSLTGKGVWKLLTAREMGSFPGLLQWPLL